MSMLNALVMCCLLINRKFCIAIIVTNLSNIGNYLQLDYRNVMNSSFIAALMLSNVFSLNAIQKQLHPSKNYILRLAFINIR